MLNKLIKFSSLPWKSINHVNPFYFSTLKTRSPSAILNERGLLNQVSSDFLEDDNFSSKLKEKHGLNYISVYTGYDPTADSLHLGNLLSILSLIRLKEAGIKPIYLVGGATGFIGDPSGKSKERELLEVEQLKTNVTMIENTIKKAVTNVLLYLKDNKDKLKLGFEP